MSPVAANVDAYLAALPREQRAALEKLRGQIKAAAPDATEGIGYGMPGYKYKGRPLIYFGAAKNHCALYGPIGSVLEAHEDQLEGYDISKGTLRFTPQKPLPAALVRKMVKARIAEIEAGAKDRRRR